MTTGTTLVLLGFGLGALLVASRGGTREDHGPTATELSDLRGRAIEAQRTSAEAAQRARELTERWQRERASGDTALRKS